MPKQRVYETDGGCYLISFKTEGVQQLEEGSDKDDGDEDSDLDPEDDDLLEDELKALEKGNKEAEGKGQNKKEEGQSDKLLESQNIDGDTSAQKGSKTVKRALIFHEECKDSNLEHTKCVNLLKTMELEDSDVEDVDSHQDTIEIQEDEELSNLPLEWIEGLETDRTVKSAEEISSLQITQSYHEGMLVDTITQEEGSQSTQPTDEIIEKATRKQKEGKEKVWGPVIATRKSKRGMDDGRTMLEKAQDIKRKYTLEDNEGNKKPPRPLTNKASLSIIASQIGLVSQDGNLFSNSMLDSMLELDDLRSKNFVKTCEEFPCSSSGISSESGVR